MLERDNRPRGEARHFLRDSLDPRRDDGHFPRLRADRHLVDVRHAHVGLVEHVRVVVQTQQVARVDDPRVV